ncbi:HD domain-containing protein [Pseudomonas sp. RT6P73]
MLAKRSWDPLYGRIEMSDFEFGLLNLAEVQRLRYVRMCNINSMLITGASEISRFEHIIGVMYLAKQWVLSHGVPESEGKDFVAAAILHDMQTGPFGHSMQYVLEDNELDSEFLHDDLSHGLKAKYYQELLAGASFSGKPFGAQRYLAERWANVASLIRGGGDLGPLIAGTMDLDNIDNVIRLAYHVGITEQSDLKIPLELASNLSVSGGIISLPNKCIKVVERWQEIRSRLYTLLLLDWAEFSAKAMLTKIIERAAHYELIGADSWILTDHEFLDRLERTALGESQEVKELVSRLKCGDLYQPIVLLSSDGVEQYARLSTIESKGRLEKEIIKNFKGKAAKVLVHFILDNGKTQRSVTFFSEDDFCVKEVGANTHRVLAGLFVANSISEQDRQAMRSMFVTALSGEGLHNITELDDPMGSSSHEQATLL